ncbi:LVIVD repeat-containing protein [Myxococcus fulvus]|uniref:LVIVD repeat-containing protein n=1 Tax=Myxococcus fulvus TaxID=33 RepID=UPI003B9A4748
MTRTLRPLGLLLSTLCLASLAGCDEDTPSPPDAGQDAGIDSGSDAGHDAGPSEDPDAGGDAGPYVWDGTYVPLEETGDIDDQGLLAACKYDPRTVPATICNELDRADLFDLSQCDLTTLGALPQEGIYQVELRGERALADGGTRIIPSGTGFHLKGDGGTSTLYDNPLLKLDMEGDRFVLQGQQARTQLIMNLTGCETKAPNLLTGCFAYCSRGRFSFGGTFEAHRVALQDAEPESSGGLELLSERRVPTGHAVDVHVAKGHAYVVSLPFREQLGGLTVFDVSNPRSPVQTAAISLPGDNFWNSAWAKGDALYIASSASGFIVYDISQPAEPLFVRSVATGGAGGAHTVLVEGNFLYAMDPVSGTFIYELTNPFDPVLRAVIPGGPHDAFIYEGRLYLSDSFDGYAIHDLSNLEDIRELGRFTRPDGFSHHNAVGTFGGKTIAFEGGEFNASHVRALDVSDPANIVKIGTYKLRRVTSMHNLILRGNLLYIAWYHEGLRVVDVSNPTQLREVAHHHVFRETDPLRGDSVFEGLFGLRLPGDGHVYTAESSRGLMIFNEL